MRTVKRHHKKRKPDIVKVDVGKLEELLDRVKDSLLEEDYELLRNLVDSYVFVTGLVEDGKTTIKRLRQLLFGAKTEKTRKVCPKETETEAEGLAVAEEGACEVGESGASCAQEEKKRKGHGRNGAQAYKGAKRKQVCHETLEPGDICPKCQKGRVYEQAEPRRLVRVVGQAPVTATVYELQRLRCNLCGHVFTAKAPPGVGEAKYDATVASMIALMKYGSGLPFNRLGRLEGNLGIPLPAATQWDIVHRASDEIKPVHEELIRQAAQGEVLHNDDTGMKILELMGDRDRDLDLDAFCAGEEKGSERRSVFTSGIVSIGGGRKIALFFTGPSHAGERLGEVLAARAAELSAPIQMCDALSRNVPEDFQVILANCLAHGRRKFADVAGSFPAECRHVLETLSEVYGIDAGAREGGLSPQERLELHQSKSAPLMEKLKGWLEEHVNERKVEPNSGLGQAIAYMLKHWKKLTLFLREAGAPLDNNVCERALKKAILHRKNALFYKTQNGAHVGDMYMSLIYTAELSKVSAFDYLTALQRNARDVAANPAAWMPWNYQETLERAGKPEA